MLPATEWRLPDVWGGGGGCSRESQLKAERPVCWWGTLAKWGHVGMLSPMLVVAAVTRVPQLLAHKFRILPHLTFLLFFHRILGGKSFDEKSGQFRGPR